MAGMLLLPRRKAPLALRMRVLLDALMTMAAVVTFSWFFTLGPTILAAEGGLLEKGLTTAYPLLDIGILFCVLVMSGNPAQKDAKAARSLLCLGTLAFVAADVAFAYVSLKSDYQVGAIDAGWFGANLLLGLGARRLRKAGPGEDIGQGSDGLLKPVLWRSLLPYSLIPAVAALVIHVWRGGAQGPLANGVYVGSGVLMALVLVRQVFALVENSRLYSYLQEAYRELEALATTDGMTGLWNHRTFQERFRSELARSRESGQPVALLLIDVDRFKSYNDAFGHPAGDEALRLVAKVLKGNVRSADVPARYGGEEFAVVMLAASEGEALSLAEEIRAACASQEFPRRAVTLSIGVVSTVGGDADEMIEAADRGLYAAKHAGRNRVIGSSQATLKEVELPSQGGHAPSADATDGPPAPSLCALGALLGTQGRPSRSTELQLPESFLSVRSGSL
jgi:diguanylate cyclase (GGDEF)-like protein